MARRPGKYATVTPHLPKFVDPDTKRAEKVEALAQTIKNNFSQKGVTINAAHVAACYEELRKEKEVLEEKLSDVQLEIDAFSSLIRDFYEREGVESMKLLSGGTVRIQSEPAPSIVDPERFRSWCILNGYEREFKLHSSTAYSIIKERLLEGKPQPDGTTVAEFKKIVYSKA